MSSARAAEGALRMVVQSLGRSCLETWKLGDDRDIWEQLWRYGHQHRGCSDFVANVDDNDDDVDDDDGGDYDDDDNDDDSYADYVSPYTRTELVMMGVSGLHYETSIPHRSFQTNLPRSYGDCHRYHTATANCPGDTTQVLGTILGPRGTKGPVTRAMRHSESY